MFGAEFQDEHLVDGSRTLTLQQSAESHAEVMIIATLPVTRRNTSEWQLPNISVIEANSVNNYLVFGQNAGLEPSENGANRLSPAETPRWVQDLLPLEMTTEPYLTFAGQTDSWQLRRTSTFDKSLSPSILLAETWIWLSSEYKDFGRSLVNVVARRGESITFDCPEEIEIHSIFVNGQHIGLLDRSQNRELSIPLSDSVAGHTVRLFWSRERPASRSGTGRISCPVPTPQAVPVERSLLTIVPPPNVRCIAANGMANSDEFDHALDRLGALLRIKQIRSAQDDSRNSHLDRAILTTADRLTMSLSQSTWSSSELYRKRYSALSGQVEAMRLEVVETPAQDDELTFQSLANHDEFPADAGTDILLVHGEFESDQHEDTLSLWCIEENAVQTTAAMLGFSLLSLLIVRPSLRTCEQWKVAERLSSYPALSWGLLGFFWWAFLAPVWVGYLLLILAIGTTVRNRRRVAPAPTTTSH